MPPRGVPPPRHPGAPACGGTIDARPAAGACDGHHRVRLVSARPPVTRGRPAPGERWRASRQGGNPMARLVSTLVSGAKDIPQERVVAGRQGPAARRARRNEARANGTNGEHRSWRRAGDAVRDAMPGRDSVENRLARARRERRGRRRGRGTGGRGRGAGTCARRAGRGRGVRGEAAPQDVDAQQRAEVEPRVAGRAGGGGGAHPARAPPRPSRSRTTREEQEASGAARSGGSRRGRAGTAGGPRAVRRGDRAAGPGARPAADEAAALAQEAAERARADAERISAAVQSRPGAGRCGGTQARRLRERTRRRRRTSPGP